MRKLVKGILCFLGAILIIEIALWVYILFGSINEIASKEDSPIIYDSPSENKEGVLQEFEGACPLCGNISYGINGNIVCRNENCPNYGLAVPVEE